MLQSMKSQRVGHNLVAEQQQSSKRVIKNTENVWPAAEFQLPLVV